MLLSNVNNSRWRAFIPLKSIMKLHYLIIALLSFGIMSCMPEETPDDAPVTVDFVDPEQYIGLWYEIASYPQFFEFGCNCVTATYGIREDGLLSVYNQCTLFVPNGPANNIFGTASIVPETGNAQLKVSFTGDPENRGADYWIIGLADDYSWAMVSDPFRNTFWILSRTPEIEQELYVELLDMAEDKGFQKSRIRLMNQGC